MNLLLFFFFVLSGLASILEKDYCWLTDLVLLKTLYWNTVENRVEDIKKQKFVVSLSKQLLRNVFVLFKQSSTFR